MRILGIDPGTKVVGYGVLEVAGARMRCLAHGSLAFDARLPRPVRLHRIHRGLGAVVRRWKPDEVAVEEAFYAKDARAALRIGEGRGVALLVAAAAGLPVGEYPPATVKKAVAGSGRADKAVVQRAAVALAGLRVAPARFDASDAIAVALCHAFRRGAPAALARPRRRRKSPGDAWGAYARARGLAPVLGPGSSVFGPRFQRSSARRR